MSMKLCELAVIVMALVGLTTIINPDVDKSTLTDNMLLICKICMFIVIIDIIPRVLKKMKNIALTDLASIIVFPVGIGFMLISLNPDMDEHTVKMILTSLVIVGILFSSILRRYVVKKWGKEINSYHPDTD